MGVIESHRQLEAPLEVIVQRSSEELVKVTTQQIGIQLKGSHPVVVNKVEKGKKKAYMYNRFFFQGQQISRLSRLQLVFTKIESLNLNSFVNY